MKRIKTYEDMSVPKSDPDLIIKYLGIIEDIFLEFEDNLGIRFSILHYEKETKEIIRRSSLYGYNYINYTTTDVTGNKGTFQFSTTDFQWGYFTIAEYISGRDFSSDLNELGKYSSRVKDAIDHEIEIKSSASKDGYIGSTLILLEPLW